MSGEMDAQSGGDIGVSIDKNYGPITISYGASGGGSGGGDEPPSGFMYFSDMTVHQLKELKTERRRWILNAWIKIITNMHTVLFALLITAPLITVTGFSLWGYVFGNQYYLTIWAFVFLINAYFGRRVIPDYLQFIHECKAEIAGINHALTRKKMMINK